MAFKDIALPLVARDVPVIPLRPKTKIAFLDGWQELATTDAAQIEAWSAQYPEANCGCVALAKPGGIWFWEIDKPEVSEQYKQETGQQIQRTFRVRSRPGRGHVYFRHNELSIAMGNIAQVGKCDGFSVRTDREYVVSPGSLHPITGLPYEIVSTAPIIEADEVTIKWLTDQRRLSITSKPASNSLLSAGPIVSGSRNSALTSLAGTLRQKGLDGPALEAALQEINRHQCQPPLDESEVHTIAWSVARYEINPVPACIVGGQNLADPNRSAPTQVNPAVPAQVITVLEPVQAVVPPVKYPVFPDFVMPGTSIYDGFVKPVCDVNSRYPEFMFMPALLMLMNCIGGRVAIAESQTIGGALIPKKIIPSLFLVMIGRKGKVIKSSSAEDAVNYFKAAGLADWAIPQMKNADGKSLVWTVGSPEGLGCDMSRLGCNNGVLFYDELSDLTAKASIESSSLSSKLLTLYESGQFANLIKNKKESYSLPAGSYCASLIACTTDKNFHTHWAKLAGESSGLNERFFFLYQPEILKDLTPLITVPTNEGAALTAKRIAAAVQRKLYSVFDSSPYAARIKDLGNRSEIRAEKFALAFAVDMGLEEINEECVERALALSTYEIEVKRYLKTMESRTKEAALQNSMMYQIRQAGGKIALRKLEQNAHKSTYGTTLWGLSLNGLVRDGQIALRGNGQKGSPFEVILIRYDEDEEE